jgi:hypothetical protein
VINARASVDAAGDVEEDEVLLEDEFVDEARLDQCVCVCVWLYSGLEGGGVGG